MSLEIIKELRKLEEQGYVTSSEYKSLILFNYSPKTTFEKYWTKYTLEARGTIYNKDTGEIVAKGFQKFFNYSEMGITEDLLPKEKFVATIKHDGCFLKSGTLNLWEGGTIKIGDVVNKKLSPILIGMDSNGNLVPCYVTNRFNNGHKREWLMITIDCPVSKKSGGRGFNRLKVTPNHHLLVNDKYTAAANAKIGDLLKTYEEMPCKNTIKYMCDMLLGDASLSPVHRAYRFVTNHKKDHFDYSTHCSQMLGESFQSFREVISGYGTTITHTTSKTLKSLNFLRELWYPDGKKVVPKDLSWMDNESVAIWYMDDGSLSHSEYQKDRANFATNGFTKEDCQRLADKLHEFYKTDCVVYDSKGWSIRINAGKNNEIERFWESIREYIVPCMQYKLPIKHRGFYIQKKYDCKLNKITKNTQILAIESVPFIQNKLPNRSNGYDIETTTNNYMINGVIVHNSLGIVRKDEEGFKVSTRGSFYSEQAVEATKMANESPYKEAFEEMLQHGTPLVEIIFPSNRIVINYGDERKLVVLAIRRLDGTYVPIKQSEEIAHAHGVEHTMIIDNVSLEELLRLQKIINWQEEGWVLVYENGYRLKIKGIDYLRIAKIKSSLSPLSVWEAMEAGKAEEYLASMPDEIHDEAKAIYNNLTAQYATLFEKVTLLATQLGLGPKMTDNVKEDAIKIQKEAPKWAVNMMFAFMRCRWDTLKELVLKEIRPDANKYVNLKKYL